MESLIVSTKSSYLNGSDFVGGSLPMILFADFFQAELGYKVHLVDPYYGVENHLNHNFTQVSETFPCLKETDLVLNPFFYLVHFSMHPEDLV